MCVECDTLKIMLTQKHCVKQRRHKNGHIIFIVIGTLCIQLEPENSGTGRRIKGSVREKWKGV